MKVEAELTYYPFAVDDYKEVVREVLDVFPTMNLDITYTSMSTIVYGEFAEVHKLVEKVVEMFFTKYQSVLEVKYSNACRNNCESRLDGHQ